VSAPLRTATALLALSIIGCAKKEDGKPRFAVFAAMPSELAPLLAEASIEETTTIDGHPFRIGVLGKKPVVLSLTSIGIENATKTSRALFDHFNIVGAIFSGVAGSMLQIGDVAVPDQWALADGTMHRTDEAWLAVAGELARSGVVGLDHGTVARDSGRVVCLPWTPGFHIGGIGHSGDDFGGRALACQKQGDDVFGCDVDNAAVRAAPAECGPAALAGISGASVDAAMPVVNDMETAAVAAQTAARSLPFVGFRSVSDGSPDPLMISGWTNQFFVYYHLAAHNAAAAAIAFLEAL
jgi:nucleoside phosphorylase